MVKTGLPVRDGWLSCVHLSCLIRNIREYQENPTIYSTVSCRSTPSRWRTTRLRGLKLVLLIHPLAWLCRRSHQPIPVALPVIVVCKGLCPLVGKAGDWPSQSTSSRGSRCLLRGSTSAASIWCSMSGEHGDMRHVDEAREHDSRARTHHAVA